jgi:transaldolase
VKLFIDTAKTDEIKEAWSWGVIDGVTTNPTHVAASGKKFFDVIEEICGIDHPLTDVGLEQFLKDWREGANLNSSAYTQVL